MAWPRTMTWISARDIRRPGGENLNGARTLWRWLENDFGLTLSDERRKFFVSLMRQLEQRGAFRGRKRLYLFEVNRDRRNTKSLLASGWNATIEQFGYTEPARGAIP